MTPEQIEQLKNDLAQFSGTDQWYRWSKLFPYTLTDGALYLAETAGAYWLMDVIASWQTNWRVRSQPFQLWQMTVKGKEARVWCEDGNGNKIKAQIIPWTDFPLESIKLYFIDGVILLPNEY